MMYLYLFSMFFRIGIFSFGGGLAMLPLIFQSVQDFGIMTSAEFSDLVALSQVTPGPIAVNAATFVGLNYDGLAGAAAATLLEYVTGAVMERLFKVRYWDYSNQKLNLNGYICFTSTFAWGFFSILLVKFIHPPIARLVMAIPSVFAVPLALALVAAFSVDAVQSVRAALDLRAMLEKLTEENEELRRLARRVEIVSAFAEEDLQKFRDRTQVERILLQDRLRTERQERLENKAERKLHREERLADALRTLSEAKLSALENVASAMESCRDRLECGEAFAQKRAEFDDAVKKLRERQTVIKARTAKTYRQSLRILRGNPSAMAKEYAEAMENLRRLGGMHKD